MGCALSSSNPEAKILSHINSISSIIELHKLKAGSAEHALLEELIRVELLAILQQAKSEHSLKPYIFHDLISVLDDFSLTFETVATKVLTLSNAVKKVVRIKCIGLCKHDFEEKKNEERKDEVGDEIQKSLHVIQTIIHSSVHDIDRKKLNLGNKVADDDSDYGFYDIGTSSHNGSSHNGRK